MRPLVLPCLTVLLLLTACGAGPAPAADPTPPTPATSTPTPTPSAVPATAEQGCAALRELRDQGAPSRRVADLYRSLAPDVVLELATTCPALDAASLAGPATASAGPADVDAGRADESGAAEGQCLGAVRRYVAALAAGALDDAAYRRRIDALDAQGGFCAY